MDNLQSLLKELGLNKTSLTNQKQIINHFLLKLLENQNINHQILEQLQQQVNRSIQLMGKNSLEQQYQTISQLPDFSYEGSINLMQKLIEIASKPIKTKKKIQIPNIDPDFIDFSKITKENFFMQDPEIFSHGFFMKKFQRMKTILGHQKQQNFHENLDPEEQTIPLYNILYDNSGKLLITGDDNGLIKVWSTFNMQLLYQLRGHSELIHAIEITPDNNFLITCSQDQTIRIWNMETQKVHNILTNAHQNSILTVALYKKHLVSLAENGQICVYLDFLAQQYQNAQQLQRRNIKEASCLAVSDFGEIVMGTSEGTMFMYESIEQLKYKNNLNLQEWKFHTKSIHSVVFNKNSDHFISGSLDGTVCVWNWYENINIFDCKTPKAILRYDDSKPHNKDSKICYSVNFSSQGNYVIAAIARKIRKNQLLEVQIQVSLVIYSCQKNKIINRLGEETCGMLMNKEIYVIESHPINEEVIFTADSEGFIILWDIEQGIVLNIFKEMAMPFLEPNLDTPIVDARFSPDGLQFAVSTFYGNASIYGYGPKQIYNYSYYDQFGEKDYMEVKTRNEDLQTYSQNGVLFQEIQDTQLDYKQVVLIRKNIKEIQLNIDFYRLMRENFFSPTFFFAEQNSEQQIQKFNQIKLQNKKRKRFWKIHFLTQKNQTIAILRQQALQKKQPQSQEANQQKTQISQAANYIQNPTNNSNNQSNAFLDQEYPQSISPQQQKDTIIEEKNDEMSKENSSEEDEYTNSEKSSDFEQELRQTQNSSRQQRYQQQGSSSRITRNNHLQLSQNTSEQIAREYQRNTRLSSLATNQIRNSSSQIQNEDGEHLSFLNEPFKKKKLKLDSDSEDQMIIKPKQKESYECQRCCQESEQGFICDTCQICFCGFCMEIRGQYYGNNFYCFTHLREKELLWDRKTVKRSWFEDDSVYQIQIDDEVYYMWQGHEEFIKEYCQYDEKYPFDKYDSLKMPTLCKVIDLDYEMPKYTDFQGFESVLLVRVSLEFCNQQFSVLWSNEESKHNYLIPKNQYEEGIKSIKKLNINQLITFEEEQWNFDCIEQQESKYETYWRCVKIYQSKTRSQKVDKKINLWDIIKYDFKEDYKSINLKQFNNQLKLLIETIDSESFLEFVKQVDHKLYPDYLENIFYEMYIQKIIKNIENNHYRSQGQLINHIKQIKKNAQAYNLEQSNLYQFSEKVEKVLLYLFENYQEDNQIFVTIKKKFGMKFKPTNSQIQIRKSQRIK